MIRILREICRSGKNGSKGKETHPMTRQILVILFFPLLVFLTACSTPWMTNTTRNAVEQYLLSTTVERALSAAKFQKYENRKVFLDYDYFTPQTDKAYAQGVLEARLAQFKMIVVKKEEEADIVIRPLCGVLATDYHKILIGTPSLPLPVPDTGISLVIPEIPLFQKFTRCAYGKFSFVIFESKTRKPLETIPPIRTSARYVNWVILLIPFKTHDMDMDDMVEGTTQYNFTP